MISITLGVITGIFLGEYLELSIGFIGLGLLLSLMGLLLLHLMQNKYFTRRFIIFIPVIITSIFTGFLLHYRINQRHFDRHYTYYLPANTNLYLSVDIIKELKPTHSYYNYIAEVKQVNNHSVFGKILVKLPASQSPLLPGNSLYILTNSGAVNLPEKNKNPYNFNYRKYLQGQGVYRIINLKDQAYRVSQAQTKTLAGTVVKIRQKLKKYFIDSSLTPAQSSLLVSLLLGERQVLSAEMVRDFKAAGTIHILAISGLHIGILLLLLNFIFRPLKRRYNGLYILLTLAFLWFYALLTGFSASVLRAVIMFSFLQVSLQINRKTNLYNTLAMAALFMLLIYPQYLFQVGFQMSFIAVLSIVSFQPLFSKLWVAPYKPLQWFLDLFWVSLSAQLGILPLMLYYFHQFPAYFWLANLLVIPLLFVLLFMGFFMIFLALLDIKIALLFKLIALLLDGLMYINHRVALWENSLIQNIDFSVLLLIISLLGLLLWFNLWVNPKKFSSLLGVLLWILIFQSVVLFEHYRKSQRQTYYVLHQYATSIIAKAQGDTLHMYAGGKINPYLLQAFRRKYDGFRIDSLPVFQRFGGKNILHIDSLGLYKFSDYHPDIVVLHDSPKINLDRMLSDIKPVQIIAASSNYPSLVKRWQISARKYGIPFYDVNTEGAYVWEYTQNHYINPRKP